MASQPIFFIESLSDLYTDVQLQEVFPDSKFFVDCIPKNDPATILQAYHQQKAMSGFDIRQFVMDHFIMPPTTHIDYQSGNKPILQHLGEVWDVLTRQPEKAAGTLLQLPHPYIVPGGRFREIYYWDSYFTMLGLQVSGRIGIIEHMIANFAFLIDTVGFIPNGNRSYYLGRSQPPFFTLMVELLAEEKGNDVLLQYQLQIEKEYAFWMDGEEKLKAGQAHRHLVCLADGSLLNRYWDDHGLPRPEAYIEDLRHARQSGRDEASVYRHIRAAAESGWDFSSRWFADRGDMTTIHTTDILPVDLNCLLLHTEQVLLNLYQQQKDAEHVRRFTEKINRRKEAIHQYFFDAANGFYVDYDFKADRQRDIFTLAAVYPLFLSVADHPSAEQTATMLGNKFLQAGGLLTTLLHTGQQWDAPNGWAPLQWMAYKGLRNYGHDHLAGEIKKRWLALNERVYAATGKMMEKYNVSDTGTGAGGGEYPNQDGFGWTNGVYLKMQQERSNI